MFCCFQHSAFVQVLVSRSQADGASCLKTMGQHDEEQRWPAARHGAAQPRAGQLSDYSAGEQKVDNVRVGRGRVFSKHQRG